MLFKALWTGFAAVLSAVSAVHGYANPGACSGQCWSHDPSVIRRSSDGTYFRFETGSCIGIWKASDLTGPWEYQGKVLPSGSMINLAGNDDLWVSNRALRSKPLHRQMHRLISNRNPRPLMSVK